VISENEDNIQELFQSLWDRPRKNGPYASVKAVARYKMGCMDNKWNRVDEDLSSPIVVGKIQVLVCIIGTTQSLHIKI